MLVGLMHNSTSAKEQQKVTQGMPSKMSVKVSFVTPGMEKIGEKKSRGLSVVARLP